MKWFILCFLTASLFSAAAGQDSLLLFADYLLSRKEYGHAATEYQRVGGQKCRALRGQGLAWQKMGRHGRARDAFDAAVDQCGGRGTEGMEAHLDLVKSCMKRGEYSLARFELKQARQYRQASDYDHELRYLDLLIDARLYQTDSAFKKLQDLKEVKSYQQRAAVLDSLMVRYRQSDFKDPWKAYLLSSFIPGGGQFYNGSLKKSAGAFFLVSSLSAVMAWCGYRFATGNTRERYIFGADFVLFGMMVWQRYYSGSCKSAYETAVLHNREIQLEYQKKLDALELIN